MLGWARSLYSSITFSRSSSSCELAAPDEHAGRGCVLELLHARAQVAGDVWLLAHGKEFGIADTTYFGLVFSLTAHLRIARSASLSLRATAGQELSIIS
jgi:hypothetical protein